VHLCRCAIVGFAFIGPVAIDLSISDFDPLVL